MPAELRVQLDQQVLLVLRELPGLRAILGALALQALPELTRQ